MLFGRLRVPVERESAPEPQERSQSGIHLLPPLRDAAPQRGLALVPPVAEKDEFAGLDRLDREELDEE